MRVLLISTYELGHQPLHVASPAAVLRDAGHDVRCLDLAVETWDEGLLEWANAVAFSVPMHTAMRLAMRAAEAAKALRPDLPVCFYGLYAPVSRELTVGRLADRVIAGEYEAALAGWVEGLAGKDAVSAEAAAMIQLGRASSAVPARDLLPSLDRYCRVVVGDQERLTGYTEASHGCAHTCRHCPVPAVYDGKVRLVDRDTVLADVAQLVERGARHITFGDPDFLNGWRHACRVVRALHERHPHVTFDCTVKVEHILRHRDLWPELAGCGCLFVVSAVECLNDEILERLDKGHTAADAVEAVAVLRRAGIEMRPSFMPFTPWTRAADLRDLLQFVVSQDLVGNVDPVQYTIRLLLPQGSLLLDHPDVRPWLGHYDAEQLTWAWSPADAAMDALQADLAAIAERAAAESEPVIETFAAMRDRVAVETGRDLVGAIPAGSTQGRPRLTEPWFC